MLSPRRRSSCLSLATVLAVLGVSFGTLLIAAPRASAVTYVSGVIASDTTWGLSDTTYVITQHVTVLDGVTLTILPGTTVRVDPGRYLFAEGRLVASGNSASPIAWVANNTISLLPPMGIQFNATGTGSVSWNTLTGFDRPLVALDSAPSLTWNTITTASIGITLIRSAAYVAENNLSRTQTGIVASESTGQIVRNGIDLTNSGIQVSVRGNPYVAFNRITNVSASLAFGIYVWGGASANLWWNTIRSVQGARGNDGVVLGAPGDPGGLAAGIAIDGAPSATVTGNTIDQIQGGRGGDGVDNPGGTGGRGGNGGDAIGVAAGATPTILFLGNSVTNLVGGRGGNGGGSAVTVKGGDGGWGGAATALQTMVASGAASWTVNSVNRVTGGVGGNGGSGTGSDGPGGRGGGATGVFALAATDGDATGNFLMNLRGGFGGNSTAVGAGNSRGGDGGAATGLAITGNPGSLLLDSNTVWTVTGGTGGRGASGGTGGNATAGLVIGNADGLFNASTATNGHWLSVTGGVGGVGSRFGGDGGAGAAMVFALVSLSTDGNSVNTVRGGNGGDALDGTDGGRGGDAYGVVGYAVKNGWSSLDAITTVAKGAVGSGPPAQTSIGAGWVLLGDASFTTRMTVENGTLSAAADLDLQVNDFVDATTINTSFAEPRLSIAATSRLTVKNHLGVDAVWPNGVTPVPGASILVTDEGTPVWSLVSPSGRESWLLVTDRVYEGSIPARDNRTEVTVTYLSYGFANDPRTVDMAASNTQVFVMVDGVAPTSTAGPLPTFETTATFSVPYTATDGNGVGLGNITLYYRKDGAGGWTLYATQAAGNAGQFSFVAAGDGTYEFATVADDRAGNREPGPSANETWTILDTTRPLSSVAPQPTWRNTLTFLVTWGPDPGVTDIATYTIQYHRGFGWVNWLVGTTATSGTFTASSQGVYQFRSIATDLAGNVEAVAGNDTWTIVDTWAPEAGMTPLSPWQTSTSFLVQWSSGAPDVASFQVQFRDNGGAWTNWFPATTARSATFTGVDAHTYEFRCTATDFAGNADPLPANNQTWTTVDVTPPDSAVAALPTFIPSLTINLAWGPAGGTTDIATYTVQASDDGGAWTNVPGLVGTTSQIGSHTGLDAHTYAFRTVATDWAGNVEPASGNDTWTVVDVTPPTTTATLSGTPGLNNWYTSGVTVTLSASDGTSGAASSTYRLDSGAWQSYAAPVLVSADGSHTVDYGSTDNAGIVEVPLSVSFRIDTTPPTTSASMAGTAGDNGWMRSAVIATLTPTDAASGVAGTSYRLDGGQWQTYVAPVTVATDGAHTMEYYATDSAGVVETAKTVTFRIDTTEPLVVTTAPRGAGTNTTPSIVITFSEPVDPASTQAAFSITPDMNGAFRWSADARTMAFDPDRALQPATDYFVVIDRTAKDLAGNMLPAAATFQFTTASPLPPGAGAADYLWILAVIAAGLGGTAFIVMRRVMARGKPVAAAKEKTSQAMIDDVFLLYRDGILIKHETRRLKPDIDTDILSGMLTAVQSFVKDSFRSEEGELDELTFGEMHILIGRGKWLILAAMVQGDGITEMRGQIEASIADMERTHPQEIESWDGNMTIAKVLSPFIKKLIRGEYV